MTDDLEAQREALALEAKALNRRVQGQVNDTLRRMAMCRCYVYPHQVTATREELGLGPMPEPAPLTEDGAYTITTLERTD